MVLVSELLIENMSWFRLKNGCVKKIGKRHIFSLSEYKNLVLDEGGIKLPAKVIFIELHIAV